MFEYEKTIIGYLIRYYRTKNKILAQDFFSYKSEIMEEYCAECKKQCKSREAISSHKTLERIERGQPSKNDCYYIDFADKLGFKYEMSLKYVKKIDEFEKELLRLIRNRKENDFLKFKQKLLYFKNQVDGLIYFEEILNIYLFIINLEVESTFCDDENLRKMKYLFDYVRHDTKKIISYYFVRFYFRYYNREILKDWLSIAEKTYPENIQILFHSKTMELDQLDLLSYIIKYDRKTLKGADYYFYYQALGLAYLNLGKNEDALKYIDKALKFAIKEEIINEYIYQTYMRKGILLYQLERYQEAVESFEKVFYHDINIMVMNLILFLHCFELLDRESEILLRLSKKQYNKLNSDNMMTVFTYYTMKCSGEFELDELEDYIINNLKPLLRRGTWYEEIIRNDLIKYTEITRNYKKIYLYMKEDKKKRQKKE